MMAKRRGSEQVSEIPVEKRLSGEFGSPLELMGANGLSDADKRQILTVWLKDLDAQAATAERDRVRDSVLRALGEVDARQPTASRRPGEDTP
ncbi:MAG: hypothetical protein SFW09_14290 [Hyphomicrobiaceae bacterium]|nr:hypothetical protein [Hyphomicrobiaceae bacterium]